MPYYRTCTRAERKRWGRRGKWIRRQKNVDGQVKKRHDRTSFFFVDGFNPIRTDAVLEDDLSDRLPSCMSMDPSMDIRVLFRLLRGVNPFPSWEFAFIVLHVSVTSLAISINNDTYLSIDSLEVSYLGRFIGNDNEDRQWTPSAVGTNLLVICSKVIWYGAQTTFRLSVQRPFE